MKKFQKYNRKTWGIYKLHSLKKKLRHQCFSTTGLISYTLMRQKFRDKRLSQKKKKSKRGNHIPNLLCFNLKTNRNRNLRVVFFDVKLKPNTYGKIKHGKYVRFETYY